MPDRFPRMLYLIPPALDGVAGCRVTRWELFARRRGLNFLPFQHRAG